VSSHPSVKLVYTRSTLCCCRERERDRERQPVFQCIVVFGSVLQCVALRCSALQAAAVVRA